MKRRRSRFRNVVDRALAGLLRAEVGAEVRAELRRELGRIEERRGRALASLWYVAQLLRPQTWLLAFELWRAEGSHRRGLVSGLDVKLGLRMLVKHPAVTLVIVLALGIGIPASLLPHVLIDAGLHTPPPLEDGDRIAAILMANPETGNQEPPGIHDYELWQSELSSVDDLGAAIVQSANLIDDEGRASPVRGATMTASSFTLARTPPLLGRTLTEADEAPGAPHIAVIGYDLWTGRFAGDPDIVGKSVRIAGSPTAIVGVMPAGFEFPGQEQLWLPFRVQSMDHAPGSGPGLAVYGRLGPGVSASEAQAELDVLSNRAPLVDSGERVRRRAELARFSALTFGTPKGFTWVALTVAQALPFFLLLIVCGNVAVLLMARTANRTVELAVRTALGASRARVVTQIFVETLLLAGIAAGAGLFLLDVLLERIDGLVGGPFWLDLDVTLEVAAKAFLVAAVAAGLASVFPTLKATGRRIQGTLQRGDGGGGVRFGKLADLLIITEVGLGVGALFGGIMAYRMFSPAENPNLEVVEADRFLAASISVPPAAVAGPGTEADDPRYVERVTSDHLDLARRLGSEPGVRAVAFADGPPGGGTMERRARFADDGFPPDFGGHTIVISYVDHDFFPTLGVTPISGRLLRPSDTPLKGGELPTAVVVNSKFVERMAQGDLTGRVLRMSLEPGGVKPDTPTFEIVGVVPDVEATEAAHMGDGTPMAYLPAAPGTIHPLTVVLDLGESPGSFAPRLREIVADTDPAAMVQRIEVVGDPGLESQIAGWALMALGGLALIAILLSTAALYALMSFTVARRTREIGIRTALGGSTSSIMATVARRALLQLAVGVTLGSVFWAAALSRVTDGSGSGSGDMNAATTNWPWILLATSVVVVLVGLAACLRPTLRGLRIRPVEALRVEA